MTSLNEWKELSKLLTESLHEEAARVAVPPAAEAWARLAPSLAAGEVTPARPIRRHLFSPLAAAVLAAVVLTAAGLGYSSATSAFGRRFFSLVVSVLQGGAPPQDVHISMSNVTPPPPGAPPPPPDWPLATGERVVNPEEARQAAGFAFKEPAYLPRGLRRDIVTLLPSQVNQYFRDQDTRLILRQHHVPHDFAASSFFSNAQVEKVNIGGAEGTLVVQRNPFTQRDEITLLWFADNIEFHLEGNINSREALKVARSLK